MANIPTNEKVTKISKSTDNKKLPQGAKVLSKETSVEIEEIENGYIISRRDEVKYSTEKGGTDWMYITRKWFSEEDPLTINTANKELADVFKG